MKPSRLLCPWNFPGKNTGVVAISYLINIYPNRGSVAEHHLNIHWFNSNDDSSSQSYQLVFTFYLVFPD